MTRRIFIIDASLNHHKTDFYKGVKSDVQKFIEHFTSPLGGFFFREEISCLVNPEESILAEALSGKKTDFAVVVFCGEGKPTDDNQSLLTVNYSQKMQLEQLVKLIQAERKLVIINCGRWDRSSKETGFSENLPQAVEGLEHFEARKVFDKALGVSKRGVQIMLSSSPGAKLPLFTSEGTIFTRCLLKATNKWINFPEKPHVLATFEAVRMANIYLKSDSSFKQQAIATSIPSGCDFPFAVK